MAHKLLCHTCEQRGSGDRPRDAPATPSHRVTVRRAVRNEVTELHCNCNNGHRRGREICKRDHGIAPRERDSAPWTRRRKWRERRADVITPPRRDETAWGGAAVRG